MKLLLSSLQKRWQKIKNLISAKPAGKLSELVVQNWIVDDSDSKPSEFDRRLRYKSDSKTTIESTMAISISFWLKLINYDLFPIKSVL